MKISPRIVAFACVPVIIAVFFWLHPPTPWTWLQTLGTCLASVGFPLWLLAHIQLGSSFAVAAEARSLVTRGLYAKFRNPIYIFGSLGIAGVFLLAGLPYLLLVFVILIPLQVFRARQEARVLETKFGAEYRDYSRKTWL